MLTSRTSSSVTAWIAPLLVAVLAVGVNRAAPLASPLLVALVIGVIVANTSLGTGELLRGHASATKLLLRLGVALLGLRLPLGDILDLGLAGLVVVLVTAGVTFAATCLIGDRMGVDRGLVTLIAAGFSICGAAAIAAVEGGIRRRTEDVALAIAMVTLFGSAMIVVVPLVARAIGLTDQQTGVWAGASIHEVAQVIAAASTAGAAAVAVATTIKLGRVAMLAPAYVAARRRDPHDTADGPSVPFLPWFVIAFLVAASVRTTGILPAWTLDGANVATNLLLAAAMFGLGLGMQLKVIFPVPPRVVGLAACSTVVASSVSLAMTCVLF
ncbi:YeiH family protein [Aeromicrobium sp. A1-2]|uniref:YeiH family protein n=1 Tax=Aeromicrobium sp. A1-2 TaxID=2107713 RepID=UPI0013C328DA|nr:putative sulfate exporter family transporter [Aeromicrobium sp. A1-2]